MTGQMRLEGALRPTGEASAPPGGALARDSVDTGSY